MDGLEMNFKTSIKRKAWSAKAFDHFVCCVEDVINPEKDFRVRQNIVGYGGVDQSKRWHMNPLGRKSYIFHILAISDSTYGKIYVDFFKE